MDRNIICKLKIYLQIEELSVHQIIWPAHWKTTWRLKKYVKFKNVFYLQMEELSADQRTICRSMNNLLKFEKHLKMCLIFESKIYQPIKELSADDILIRTQSFGLQILPWSTYTSSICIYFFDLQLYFFSLKMLMWSETSSI